MIQKLQHIGRLRLTGDPVKDIEELHSATAKLEEYLCKKIPDSNNVTQNSSALSKQIIDLQGTVSALTISVVAGAWPGFGNDALHAMRGDYRDPALKFFVKKDSQVATLGSNTITFDSDVPFVAVPVVSCWLAFNDGSWSAIIPDTITTTGATVTISTITNSPTIYYIAVGTR